MELLEKLFGTVMVTNTVLKEFNQSIPKWIVVAEPATDIQKGLAGYLDTGEASAIALAAENLDSLLIIDETKGRKAAKELGISVTGSLGVLIAAKEKGYLQAVKPVLEKIRQTNFRISTELIEQVLEKADES
jgi:predicted nucleic acid-binding protein